MTIRELINALEAIEKEQGNAKVIIEGKNSRDDDREKVTIHVWEKGKTIWTKPEKETTVHIY